MTKQYSHAIAIDVSGHGLGHLGQITPVVQELVARHPTARVIVRAAHAASVVRDFVGSGVELDQAPPEATLVMRSPTIVDAAASAHAYRALHAEWDAHLDREAERLAALRPAVLIADVPYLSLAAAKRIGIPAIALCSLNWLDLYRTYCGAERDAPEILRTMEAAYRSADVFLQPRPHMPMSDLANRRSIGPIARIGRQRKDEIKTALGIPRNDRIVLVTFGGIRSGERLRLPDIAGVHWLVGGASPESQDNAIDVGRLDMSFIDILASCDAVVTKVGYGTFVEAACNGVGVVSMARADWPESAPSIEWMQQNANFALADGDSEEMPGLGAALASVLNAARKPSVPASGTAEAADTIESFGRLSE